jgi:hypothetical protein
MAVLTLHHDAAKHPVYGRDKPHFSNISAHDKSPGPQDRGTNRETVSVFERRPPGW